MSDIRYDTVTDERNSAIFGGTPGEVHEWLKENTWAVLDTKIRIKIGKTDVVVAASQYKNVRGP